MVSSFPNLGAEVGLPVSRAISKCKCGRAESRHHWKCRSGERRFVYVGGGNTANMPTVWRTHGVHRALREAWEPGVVLAAMSAGAICWRVTDAFGLQLAGLPQRRPVDQELVLGGFPGGYAADDNVGLHFVHRELADVVSSVEGRSAYEVRRHDATIRERVVQARRLS